MLRSHVEDLTLAQTPRGTGAGYGLGVDIDAILRETSSEAGGTKEAERYKLQWLTKQILHRLFSSDHLQVQNFLKYFVREMSKDVDFQQFSRLYQKINEDETKEFLFVFGSNKLDSAPLSASLLRDWLDVSGNMDPSELEALQRELEMGSPLVFSDEIHEGQSSL